MKDDESVSMSSTQAEIHALVECIKFMIWYRELLKEMGLEQLQSTIIFKDNVNVIYFSEFVGHDSRSKYLINKINFIKESIAIGTVQLRCVPNDENIADILTNFLSR